MKFRKRPVIVDAVQYDGSDDLDGVCHAAADIARCSHSATSTRLKGRCDYMLAIG
jgi:hypothetical protein